MQCTKIRFVATIRKKLRLQNEIEKCDTDSKVLVYVSSVGPLSVHVLSDEGPTLETLDFTVCIDSTSTFFYFDLYLHTAYAAHYVYFTIKFVGFNSQNCSYKMLTNHPDLSFNEQPVYVAT